MVEEEGDVDLIEGQIRQIDTSFIEVEEVSAIVLNRRRHPLKGREGDRAKDLPTIRKNVGFWRNIPNGENSHSVNGRGLNPAIGVFGIGNEIHNS